MEYFDEYDENGHSLHRKVTREEAHRLGLWHRTVHIWVLCQNVVLIQQRSLQKDSYPGYYDISCAGHLSAGNTLIQGALREVEEELGLKLTGADFLPLGVYKINYDKTFHDHLFKDREFAHVYVVELKEKPQIIIQKEELEKAFWISLEQLDRELTDSSRYCINQHDYVLLEKYLKHRGIYREELRKLQ